MSPKALPMAVLLLALLLCQASAFFFSSPPKPTLYVGEVLNEGEKLTSEDGTYSLVVQNDGYLVILKYGIQSVWMSETSNCGGMSPYKLILQPDGNLVFFGHHSNSIWSTNTIGKGGHHSTMENSGNLVLYDKDDNRLWTSRTIGFTSRRHSESVDKSSESESSSEETKTSSDAALPMDTLRFGETLFQGGFLLSKNEHYKAVIQPDGNFVVYNRGNVASSAVWSTETHNRGRAPYRLVMQVDGKLVVYDENNLQLWVKDTGKKATGQHLVLQNDGKLVIYDENNKKLWTSNGRYAHNEL